MLKQVTKAQAIKAYNNGLTIQLTPSKSDPLSFQWQLWQYNNKNNTRTFEDLVESFKRCICNKEVGKTIKYYIEAL